MRYHNPQTSTALIRSDSSIVRFPDLNLDRISLHSKLYATTQVAAPFFVSSMTGGPTESEAINRRLAEACRAMGIAMGVGSQRVGIEDGHTGGLNGSIRDAIGSSPLFA
jgi:isopentenyl-diphosphate delta-isomerase